MAKKIFCDVCGDEMDYADVQPHLKGESVEVAVRSHDNKGLKFLVATIIKSQNGNGEHTDICNGCRHGLLSRLDNRPRVAEGLG